MERKELVLNPFVGASAVVEGHTFINKTIKGPTLVYLDQCNLQDCHINWVGSPESVLWEIPESRTVFVGAVHVKDCKFVRCTFDGIGFAGNAETIEWLRRQIA